MAKANRSASVQRSGNRKIRRRRRGAPSLAWARRRPLLQQLERRYLLAGDVVFISSDTAGNVGGIQFDNEDILAYEQSSGEWSLYLDGSDIGLTSRNVDAFHVNQSDGSILLSVDTAIPSLAGLGRVEDSDIVRFIPSQLGPGTSGTFQWYLDGSDVGLAPTSEDIDSISLDGSGNLIISTLSSYNVPSTSGSIAGTSSDLLQFTGTTGSNSNTGTWSTYLDGSDIGLTTNQENIYGASVQVIGPTTLVQFTTKGNFSVPGLSGDFNDIVEVDVNTLGDNTTANSITLAVDVGSLGLPAENLDGVQLGDFTGSESFQRLDFFFSSDGGGSLGGVSYSDDDILKFDSATGAYSLAFDGSDVGLNMDIDAFIIESDTSILMSLRTPQSLPGVGAVDDSDVVRFSGLTGDTTVGTFSMVFDGSDVGLTTSAEDVDGIAIDPITGNLVLSTSGAFTVPGSGGNVTGNNRDLLIFTDTLLGDTTAGTFSIFLDGASVGLNTTSEDVTGIWIDPLSPSDTFVNTFGSYSVPGLNGTRADIFAPSVPQLLFDSGSNDVGSLPIDGIFVKQQNQLPTANDDVRTVLEDNPPFVGNGDVTANDFDPDFDPLTVTEVNGSPANVGVLQVGTYSSATIQATGLYSFTVNNGSPAVQGLGPGQEVMDSYSYKIDDGLGGTDTAALIIKVQGINDAPSFTAGADEDILEDAGPQSVAGWATGIDDGDSAIVQGLAFNITGNTNPSLFSSGPSVAADGTLTYTPADDENGVAVITLELQDDGGTGDGGVDTSPPQQFTITINAVNDEPSFTVGADETVLEDAGPQSVPGWATGVSAGPPDESGQTLTFNIVGNTNPSLFFSAPSVNSLGDLNYTPADDANGSAVITLELMDNGGTANGGDDTSPTQQFTINVTAVNDRPSFTKGPDQVVLDNAGPQTVNPWATGISAGPPDESGQVLTFNITGNTDMSLFATQPSVDAAGILTYTPQVGAAGTATITLELMDNGGTADGGDDTSPPQSFMITVVPPNIAPTLDLDANNSSGAGGSDYSTSFTEGGPVTSVVDTDVDINDPDVGDMIESATITLTTSPDGASESIYVNGILPAGISVDGSSTTTNLVLTGTDSATNYESALRQIVYDNTSENPTTTDRIVTVKVNDGDADSNTANSTISVTAVNDPPTITPPAYTGNGNLTLTVPDGAGDLLDGATDPEGTAVSVVAATLTSVAATATATTADDNNVTVSANGSFTYDPVPGFTGNDAFTYQLQDNGLPLPAATTNVVATITLQDLDGVGSGDDLIWFIDEDSTGADLGTQSDPFRSLGSFSIANTGGSTANPDDGDFIFLDEDSGDINTDGTGVYAGGTFLLNNQSLIGDGSSSTLETLTGISLGTFNSLDTFSGNSPVLTTTSGNGINLATGNTVRGLDIGTTVGTGINGSNVGSLFVREVGISGTGGGVDLGSVGGSSIDVVLDSLSASSSTDEGIRLSNVSGDFDITATNGTISATGVPAVDITGDSSASKIDLGVTFQSVSSSGAASGISLTDTTGSFTITGDGSNSRNASGGTISNTTSHGIVLNRASNFSATSLDLVSPGDGNAEHGINATNITGSSNLFRAGRVSGISQTNADGIHIVNTNTNLGLFEVNDSLFTGTNGGGNDGLFVNGLGNSVMRVDVLNNSKFDSLFGDGVQVNPAGSSNVTAVIRNSDFVTEQNFMDFACVPGPAPCEVGTSRFTMLSAGSATANIVIEDSVFRDTGTQAGFLPVSSSVGVVDFVVNDTSTLNAQIRRNLIEDIELEQAIRVVGDDNATEVDVVIDDNDINDILDEDAIFIYLRDATQLGNISIINNDIGTGPDGNVTGSNEPIAAHGIELRLQSRNTVNDTCPGCVNPDTPIVANVLISGNDIVNNSSSETVDLESESDPGDGSSANPAATLNATVTSNTLVNLGTGDEVEVDSEDGAASGAGASQICLDFTGNTLNAGVGTVVLDEDGGATLDIVQASQAALATANGIPNGNVTLAGSPNFGVGTSCTQPTHTSISLLMASGGQGPGSARSLTEADLSGIVTEANSRLTAYGPSAAQILLLQSVNFAIVDLDDGRLGEAFGASISIDVDGAGYGWFVDTTPDDDSEFDIDLGGGLHQAGSGEVASGMDLLTVVMHELGHVLGLEHTEDGLMAETLAVGIRSTDAHDAVFADQTW